MDQRTSTVEEAISQLVEVVQMLCEKVDWHDSVLDDLTTKKITDRLDGIESEFGSMVTGLNDIIDGRRKREHTEGFRDKHPELSRYEGFGKGLGMDVYGMVADMTYGKSDEEIEQMLPQLIKELNDKMEAVKQALDTLNQHEAAETPEQEATEHEPEKSVEVEIESENGTDPKLLKIARAMRAR